MRTYTLVNADGQTWDLTEADRTFFYDGAGLGFERETQYRRIVSRFAPVMDELSQQDITGTVKFNRRGALQNYYDFVRFISNKPLVLHYNPGIGTFYRRGSVVSVEKTDSAEGALRALITFRCTTPWIRDVSVYNNSETQEGKTYDYTYDYIYGDFAQQTVVINSDSFSACPARLIIYGAAESPSWRHYVNGELYETGKINATIEAGRILVVDNTRIPYRIEQLDEVGNLVSDLYQQSDFSTGRFIHIMHGVNMITVASESVAELRLAVEAQLEYASV